MAALIFIAPKTAVRAVLHVDIGERARQHVSRHGWTTPSVNLAATLVVGRASTRPCKRTALGCDRVETG